MGEPAGDTDTVQVSDRRSGWAPALTVVSDMNFNSQREAGLHALLKFGVLQ